MDEATYRLGNMVVALPQVVGITGLFKETDPRETHLYGEEAFRKGGVVCFHVLLKEAKPIAFGDVRQEVVEQERDALEEALRQFWGKVYGPPAVTDLAGVDPENIRRREEQRRWDELRRREELCRRDEQRRREEQRRRVQRSRRRQAAAQAGGSE